MFISNVNYYSTTAKQSTQQAITKSTVDMTGTSWMTATLSQEA